MRSPTGLPATSSGCAEQLWHARAHNQTHTRSLCCFLMSNCDRNAHKPTGGVGWWKSDGMMFYLSSTFTKISAEGLTPSGSGKHGVPKQPAWARWVQCLKKRKNKDEICRTPTCCFCEEPSPYMYSSHNNACSIGGQCCWSRLWKKRLRSRSCLVVNTRGMNSA